MADIRGVGKPITFSDENPVREWVESTLYMNRDHRKREPANDEERVRLARWLGYRGRQELEGIVGSAAYAYTHFAGELDSEFRYHLAEHMGTEAGHGWGYIRQGDLVEPERDHSKPDPEFDAEYGLRPNLEHAALMRRDLLSYLFSGNLWPYGACTAVTIQGINITTPKVLDFEYRVVHAEEQGHHNAILQKMHDYVWQLIDRYGEEYVRKRIAEIDEAALNCGSRIPFDPPRRDFLRKYYDVPLENVTRFYEFREYLYLNVLGFPPEPIQIKTWPKEYPQPTLAAV